MPGGRAHQMLQVLEKAQRRQQLMAMSVVVGVSGVPAVNTAVLKGTPESP